MSIAHRIDTPGTQWSPIESFASSPSPLRLCTCPPEHGGICSLQVSSVRLGALGLEKVGGCHVRWSDIPAKLKSEWASRSVDGGKHAVNG